MTSFTTVPVGFECWYSSTSHNEECVEMSDKLDILALRARVTYRSEVPPYQTRSRS
jgi:hypothetical protein